MTGKNHPLPPVPPTKNPGNSVKLSESLASPSVLDEMDALLNVGDDDPVAERLYADDDVRNVLEKEEMKNQTR